MTFSIGTTPALASPLATASNTSRKLPSDARSTSPNAARTASSANAPGSPAYAMGTGSPLAGTRWRRVCVADRVIRRDDLTDNGLDGRLHRGFGIGGRRGRWQPRDGRIELGLRRLKRVELGADERARDSLQRDEVSLGLRRSLLVVVDRRCRRQRLDCRKRLAVRVERGAEDGSRVARRGARRTGRRAGCEREDRDGGEQDRGESSHVSDDLRTAGTHHTLTVVSSDARTDRPTRPRRLPHSAYRSNQAVVSCGTFASSMSARCSRAAPADTAAPRRLPAASVAPDQCSSASSRLMAAMYASIEAAMMFGPRASPRYSPWPRSPATSGGAMRTLTAPTVSVPSPSAWMS